MSDDERTMSADGDAPGHRPPSGPDSTAIRPGPGGDDGLARALGALLGLPPAVPAAAPARAPVAVSPRAPAAVPLPAPPPVAAGPAATVDDSFWGPSPVDLHPTADPDAAAALAESGFGGPLHAALGELRRLSADGPAADVPAVPVPPAPAAGSGVAAPGIPAPDEGPATVAHIGVPENVVAFAAGPSAAAGPYTEPDPRVGGPDWARRGRRSELAAWWASRRRELLPGMLVAALVVVAFAVVLISGGQGADTTRVGSNRQVPIDPSTTIPGLFADAGIPEEIGEPPGPNESVGDDRSPSFAAVGAVTTTTKPKAASGGSPTAGPSQPSPPRPSSPQPTVPPPNTTTPPDTAPDPVPDTTVATTVPDTEPDTEPDICEILPERCEQ